MRILFLHDNFPAQFGGIAQYLIGQGWDVSFATQREGARAPGVRTLHYKPHRSVTEAIHPYAGPFERAALSGQAVARLGLELSKEGYTPDIVVAHSGWGPGLYVKDVWPDTRLVGYFEWYYNTPGPDVSFFPDYSSGLDDALRTRGRNAPIVMDLTTCDAAICPTTWQASQFPDVFKSKMSVIHDGVDTEYFVPNGNTTFSFEDREFTSKDKIITYVARGMEPYRGFPQFMAALELVQKRCSKVHALIVGADRVAYGKAADDGLSFKERAFRDLSLDLERVHFTGLLPRTEYLKVLQVSSVHAYLTVPFVLSWSMLEAMSAGCLLVASDTPPVRECATEGETALLVDFFDIEAIADKLCRAIESPHEHLHLRQAARQMVVERYAAHKTLPLMAEHYTGRASAGGIN